jgi:hypothetical protein
LLLANLKLGFDAETAVRELMAQSGSALLSIVVGLHDEEETEKYRRFVQNIKTLSDAVIVAKLPLLSPVRLVQKAFLAGFHGVIFTIDGTVPDSLDLSAVVFAVRNFAPGSIFLSFDGTSSEGELKSFISQGLVPLCDADWEQVDAMLAKQGMDRKWLYFLGFYPTESDFSLKDKIMKKYLLELTNLKHTLRVSKVEESYQSSSL